MSNLPPITYCGPLGRPDEFSRLPDNAVVSFTFDGGTIELRHKGTYLEVHSNVRNGFHHLMVEPRVSNEVWIRIVPATDHDTP
jgi:hypothetical protein